MLIIKDGASLISDLKISQVAEVKFLVHEADRLPVRTCLLPPHSLIQYLHHVAAGRKLPLVEEGCYHLGDDFVIKQTRSYVK